MKVRSRLLVLSLSVVMIALSGAAQAEGGDAARGKVLGYTCHGCHGIPDYKNAYPNYSVPKLGAQHAPYLQAALKEYGEQNRSHPTMFAQASSLSDQDRADIAAYFASTAPIAAASVQGTPPVATRGCVDCHGNGGVSNMADNPSLAGQYPDYLEQALHAYKSGKRKNPIMTGIAATLSDADIKAVAAFYGQQKGLCATDQILKHGKCK